MPIKGDEWTCDWCGGKAFWTKKVSKKRLTLCNDCVDIHLGFQNGCQKGEKINGIRKPKS